jgi:SOS response regulatory protein OraA/RecX
MEYLKRKSESIVQWAASINKEIFSEKQLRKYLAHLKLSPTDIDLILAHLQYSDLLSKVECEISG